MRKFINKYGYIVAAVALVIAAVSLFLSSRKERKPPLYKGNQDLAFFVDENTGEESVLPASQVPPLPGKDGRDSLVIAVKFQSDTEKEPKTWYLVKYPTEVRDRVQSLPPNNMDRLNLLESTRQVRSPEPGSAWMPANSPDADKIVTVPDASPGHPRRPVFPVNQ